MMDKDFKKSIEKIRRNILYKLFMDIYTPMMNTPQSPKLVFKRVKSGMYPALSYGMEYDPGTFTMTGLRREHTDMLTEWCTKHSCGVVDVMQLQIIFNTEEEIAWFLLRWT